MTELEKSFLKLQGYSDFEINNWNEEENWDFRKSESFEMYKNGYEQGQQTKSLEVICKDCSIKKQISKQCDDLLKENAELKEFIRLNEEDYRKTLEHYLSEINELEKENKKLRCCGNCKHFDIIWGSPKCIINDNGTVMKLNCTCKKWELDE